MKINQVYSGLSSILEKNMEEIGWASTVFVLCSKSLMYLL